ncbi:MAG: RNA polymerase subunit sigma-70 [Chloroflexi bacterium]|nr:MAG: RNA polymerase subunit sigma-70 [Chloroflexota bacterium]
MDSFSEQTEPFRAELIIHCYRLLGSLGDAEDMVQETFLKAWQKLFQYRGDAPLRAWLYKIATNACLDELRKQSRRTLPQHNGPAANPNEPFAPPVTDPIWLDLLPNHYWTSGEAGPEARYSQRESVELAFLIAVHVLPPRQRAVLLLRDVLDWRTREVAELLDTTESSVNSALNRARKSMAQHYHPKPTTSKEADDKLLSQYLQAWEHHDMQQLIGLIKHEATLAMPPSPAWYQGAANIITFLQNNVFMEGMRWRLRPLQANAQPGFALYSFNPESGKFEPFGVQVVRVENGRIADIILYVGPELVRRVRLVDEEENN